MWMVTDWSLLASAELVGGLRSTPIDVAIEEQSSQHRERVTAHAGLPAALSNRKFNVFYSRLKMDKPMKRPRQDQDEKCLWDVKRVRDEDFRRWGVDETVAYLQREGLEEWEQVFRGAVSVKIKII